MTIKNVCNNRNSYLHTLCYRYIQRHCPNTLRRLRKKAEQKYPKKVQRVLVNGE